MKKILFVILAIFFAAIDLSATYAQPPCSHYDSLDWLVIDSPVVVKAKLKSLTAIENHPELRELKIDVLEIIRGDIKSELQIPLEISQHQEVIKLVDSQDEVLLFLVEKPRGYQQPEAKKAIDQYDPALFWFHYVNLKNPEFVFTSEIESLTDPEQILKISRKLVGDAKSRPKPARFTFTLPNNDSLTIPLNDHWASTARVWAASDEWTRKYYAQKINWGFKQHRNKPFESGYWYAKLESPGGALRFGLRIDRDEANKPYALVINGEEEITVNDVQLDEGKIRIDFPCYDSAITAKIDREGQTMTGKWRKRAGKNKWSELPFSASMKPDRKDADFSANQKGHGFLGRFKVKFSSSDDLAVAEFDTSYRNQLGHKDVRQLRGNFQTTTGDYRFLAGDIVDGKLELSVFDGAHAFLFRAKLDGADRLKGDFWSRDTWHETWTAVADQNAKLPDAFEQTRWTGDAKLEDLEFPNVDGHLMTLADEEFNGEVRIITVFGSWCPNCHDSAIYLSQLHRKYADKGLSIVGLAFELTGEFERDLEQVRRYIKRHDTQYPILLAGVADKAKASKTLPILDRVRSYPTTIFLNSKNEVISIHTGFTGPATGQAYENLKEKFEAIIEQQLKL